MPCAAWPTLAAFWSLTCSASKRPLVIRTGPMASTCPATRGIGRACALALAREGADVLVAGRDTDAGARVCAEITALGRRARFHAAELSQASAARGVVEAALAEFGTLDVLVNNAGIFER